MSQIIAISKIGENVLTATNPNNFIFHSNYNTLKIIAQGFFQYTLQSGSVFKISILHMQPIIPIVLAYVKYKGKVHMIGNRLNGRLDKPYSPSTYFAGLEVDNTYINFWYANYDSNPETAYFKFYIFEVPL